MGMLYSHGTGNVIPVMPDVIEKVTEDKKINIVDTHIVFQGNSGKTFKMSIC